jgi:hypothetical protein
MRETQETKIDTLVTVLPQPNYCLPTINNRSHSVNRASCYFVGYNSVLTLPHPTNRPTFYSHLFAWRSAAYWPLFHFAVSRGTRVLVHRIAFDIYRVSQEECARLREGVHYVKVYRYNPKHLCPKLDGYGDNGHWKVVFLRGLRTVTVSWKSYQIPSSNVVS